MPREPGDKVHRFGPARGHGEAQWAAFGVRLDVHPYQGMQQADRRPVAEHRQDRVELGIAHPAQDEDVCHPDTSRRAEVRSVNRPPGRIHRSSADHSRVDIVDSDLDAGCSVGAVVRAIQLGEDLLDPDHQLVGDFPLAGHLIEVVPSDLGERPGA